MIFSGLPDTMRRVSDVDRAARIILTVNGPGELAGWACPLAAAVQRANRRVGVDVALMPCVFATGAEPDVAARLPGIGAVSTPAHTMRWLLRGLLPAGFNTHVPSLILHLGGEPLLSLLLARQLRCGCDAYVEGRISSMRRFDRVFARDTVVAQHLPCPSTAVGDLAVDAARLKCPDRHAPRAGEPPTIGLFPGSRRAFYTHMLPFFLRVAGLAAPRMPGARWVIGRADFVSPDDLTAAATRPARTIIEGDGAQPVAGPEGIRLITDAGVPVSVASCSDVLSHATIVLTLPGTSTAELAALGIPMVVCGPTHRLADVPMPGLLGHVGRLPVVGRPLKHVATRVYASRMPYFAHPNRRAGRMIVPEVIGRITAADVAETLVQTLSTPHHHLAHGLTTIMGPPGAADRLAAALIDNLATGGRGGC